MGIARLLIFYTRRFAPYAPPDWALLIFPVLTAVFALVALLKWGKARRKLEGMALLALSLFSVLIITLRGQAQTRAYLVWRIFLLLMVIIQLIKFMMTFSPKDGRGTDSPERRIS